MEYFFIISPTYLSLRLVWHYGLFGYEVHHYHYTLGYLRASSAELGVVIARDAWRVRGRQE